VSDGGQAHVQNSFFAEHRPLQIEAGLLELKFLPHIFFRAMPFKVRLLSSCPSLFHFILFKTENCSRVQIGMVIAPQAVALLDWSTDAVVDVLIVCFVVEHVSTSVHRIPMMVVAAKRVLSANG
jgi:hypothetical protein